MSKLVIFGAGGHAKVVADIALKNGFELEGFLDDNASISSVMGYPVLGKIDDCVKFKESCVFAMGIGNNAVRKMIFEKYSDYEYPTLIHPTVSQGIETKIGKGTVVMPMAVINACTEIGDFCVINSGAVVEHDCKIGNYTLVAPHATICGTVRIGEFVWMGAGSTVNQTINICDGVTVGSGTVVIKDITERGTYVGVPATKIK